MASIQKADVDPGYYTMQDYTGVEKTDMHLHVNTYEPALIEQAAADNFRLLTINVDYPAFPPVREQLEIAEQLTKVYPEKLAFSTTFYMEGWDEPGWKEKTFKYLKETVDAGACAVKVWKNIGMDFRDKSGALVMIDNPRFDEIFDYIKKLGVPLIGHLGEPKDCWLPTEKMIVNYVRNYFTEHPEYHMYAHPEFPSYEEQVQARDNMLEKNRDKIFVGAHFASLEWSVDEIAKFLDRFPLAYVDSAARMGEIQYQVIHDREKVRNFFIKYQDRIMYATDVFQEPGMNKDTLKKDIHEKWMSDWKFFVTDESMAVDDLDEPFRGLKLPAQVIDKIYRTNADKVFPRAWKRK